MNRTAIVLSSLATVVGLVGLGLYLINGNDGGAAAPQDAVEIVFDEGEFDREVYELPIQSEVRQDVSIVLRNRDVGRPHAIGIYPEQQGEPLLNHPIIETEPVEGQEQRVFTFQAPEQSGTYFLRCTIHTGEVATVRFVEP